jgi:hypothetical protein
MNNPDYQFLSSLVQDIPDEGPSKKKSRKNNSEGNENKK